ncbi:MAG: flagellar hook-basal body complex protein [bacterium]|nr:flagellar hook-basal body complex protein [bacterium]
MGLTSAMLTGFTGIKTNQYAIDTIGDNVANVNTTAFKNQRALFETMFYETRSGGTAPDENLGGTNPTQIGHGSNLAAIQRSFVQGAVERTGVPTDLAIEGNGFFILNAADDETVYTRDGSFSLNADNVLVSSDGAFVQGFAADADGTIDGTAPTDLTIPVGTTSPAIATTSASLDGNLDSASSVATTASVGTSEVMSTAAGPAAAASALTDLVDADGAALFADGDVITVDGVEKGGIDLPEATFVVGTDGTTLGDFASFLEEALFINTDPATGGSPGVVVGDGVTGPAGALVVTSNLGEASALNIEAADILNTTSGALPFSFTSTPAVGEGVTTAFLANDSLGNPIEVRVRMALESRGDTGSVWRYYVESPNDTAGGTVGTGTVSFDPTGRFLSATGTEVSIALAGTGAVTPLTFDLDFSTLTAVAGEDGESVLVMTTQDGRPAGTLIDFGIDADGIITATFSNADTQVLGQVALATFTNPEGLIGLTDNTFSVGLNSGEAVVLAPQTEGAGRISAGALEGSNVDLSREFIGLITASTGFSAAGRVVRTADDLLQELLLLVR